MLKSVVYGVAGGVLGAAVWAALIHFLHVEIGYLAWGIGVLVGAGFALGLEGKGEAGAGIIAAIIALASVAGGKYAAVLWEVGDSIAEVRAEPIPQQWVVSYVADEVVAEYQAANRPIRYPVGADMLNPDSEEDYPADVWREANRRFDSMSTEEQETWHARARSNRDAYIDSVRGDAISEGFLGTIGIFDALWVFLAVGTAFKMASADVVRSKH